MAPKRLDLRPDRNLIDPNFDGYKLSLEPLCTYKLLINDAYRVRPDEKQYSFQHHKSISLHNHLHQDPWNSNHVYYINEEWSIMRVTATKNSQLEVPHCVFQLPRKIQNVVGNFNINMQFISDELLVLSDGMDCLYLIRTGHRNEIVDKWKVIFWSNDVAVKKSFYLVHSLMTSSTSLDCLLLHIDERSDETVIGATSAGISSETADSPFTVVLEWITINAEIDPESWKISRTRRISGTGSIDYAAVEQTGKGLCIVSDRRFKFVYDSSIPIEKLAKPIEVEESNVPPRAPKYIWAQTTDDITVWLKFDKNVTKTDIAVKLMVSHINISFRSDGNILLDGPFFCPIDVEGSTWTLQDDQLELTLSKVSKGLVWQELVKGDASGQEILSEEMLNDIKERLEPLTSDKLNPELQGKQLGTFNPQQLEECDDFPVDSYMVTRLDCESHECTHEVDLSSHQWMFSVTKIPTAMPAFCIRHDVDGVLWQASSASESGDWRCEHVGTFNALGYVLASKQEKKFLSCSPEATFTALCDSRRHLYLYFQPTALPSDLRNRKTGRKVRAVARQQLVTLDAKEVLGMRVSNENVFVLTEESFYQIKVNTLPE